MVQKTCSFCAKVHYMASKKTKACYDTNQVLTNECMSADKSTASQVRSTSYRRKRRWIKVCAAGGVNAYEPINHISVANETQTNFARFYSINSSALPLISSISIVTRHHSNRHISVEKWTRNVSLIRLQQKCSICSQIEYIHVLLGTINPIHKKLLSLNSITNSCTENNVSCNNSLPIDNCVKFDSISDEHESVIFVQDSERQLKNCNIVKKYHKSDCCFWNESQRKCSLRENLQHSCLNEERKSKNVSTVCTVDIFATISTNILNTNIEYFAIYNELITWEKDTDIEMKNKVRTSNSVKAQPSKHHVSQTFLNKNARELSKKSKIENVPIKSVERTFHKTSNCFFLLLLYVCAMSGQVMSAYPPVGLTLPGFSNVTRTDQSDVCPSMDIRNTPKAFVNLTRCRVVEGFLMISLMDKYTSADFENITFPHLTEITDYLLVYRINGLQSLGRIFPNLSVIRGNALFEGFAMIIYENMNLEEIALKSLTYVKRGAVRVEKNPKLCFVETIDWTKIAVNATLAHFQKENKMQNECPVCPGESAKYKDKSEKADVFFDTPEDLQACPLSQANLRICWNRQNCQKVCPDHCGNRACNDKGQCCDDSCIGGCALNDTKKCAACRYFTIGDGECVEKCPKNYYKYMDRRCVTYDQCRAIRKPLNTDTNEDYPFIPFNGLCSTTCPPRYEKVGPKNNGHCRLCDQKCIKKCDGGTIDSLKSAEKLRGCTIVTGSLLISIRQGGSHVIEELERSLSSIEEIEGFLKIARSYSIVSLSFLRGLRTIKGEYALDANKYALYVLDNQNLQSLFNENQTVTIEKGKIFFHFNPKLCYYKIEQLRPYIRENGTFDKADVAEDSNGDRIACNVVPLEVNITKVGSHAAVVSVKPIEFDDERGFLGYQYYYIEAPHQNISIYDSRDGCGNDAWNLDDDTSKDTFHLFSHLKPYTQYAYYVKTYTIASERKGGQSPIQYFWTEPDTPERVRNLQAYPNGSSEIVIKWDPPKVANGNLTTYVITARLSTDDNKLLDQRNYCSEPIKEHKIVPLPVPDISKTDTTEEKDEKGCSCARGDYRPGGRPIEESEVENVIEFEDAIQNFVYVKREERNDDRRLDRRRRDIIEAHFTSEPSTNVEQSDSVFPSNEKQNTASGKLNSDDDTISKKEGDYYSYFYTLVNVSTRAYVLKDLKHYSSYTISVKACREGKGNNCSLELITTGRTLKIAGADDVSNLIAVVESTNSTKSIVRLTWKPPDHPNSMIVSYYIKYHRVDIEHSKTWEKCITQREYLNLSGYTLVGLETGNYSVQVMATSLAGDGNFTSPKYFYIPETRLSTEFIWGIAIGVIVLVILMVFAIYSVVRKKCVTNTPDLKLFTSVNPEYISMQYKPDEWELEREQIIQYRELGQGSFGMVYEGIVKDLKKNGRDIPCAIKTVNESATDRERINFLNEASVMKAFDTYHVVRLLGVVSRGQPTLVVMELMTNGDLKGYLRSHRPDSELLRDGDPPPQPPTLKRILQMAIEIADGMAYLSAKKFVHRDLAARNCMVAEDLTVKIGDFGMTRDIYETDYYRKGTKGLLPVRWMAPESLKDGVFTSASDVFSYGVVLWEMATLASQPYQGLSNDQVLRYVIDGGVMERPENCPDKLYDLMRKCWQHRPSSRPTFMDIIQSLLDDADTKFRQVSFFHSDEGQEILDQMHPVTDIDDVTTPLRMEDDEFKLDVDNFLMERTDSHLGQEQHQNSPYSFGSAVITKSNSSVSGGEWKSHDINNPPVNMNFKSTAKGRRNNNAAPVRFPGMEFLRNTFLKSNSFNNNSGIHGIDYYNGLSRENTDVNSIEANSGCSKGFAGNSFSESARNFFNGLRTKNGNSHNETKAAIVAYVGNDSLSIPSVQFLKDYRMVNQMSEFDSCVKPKTKPSFKSRSPFQSRKTTENPNYGVLKSLGSSSLSFIPRTYEQNKVIGMNQVAACNLSNCNPNITQFESSSKTNAELKQEQKDLKEKSSNQCEKTECNAHINGFVLLSIPHSKSALQDRHRLHEQKNVECFH